VRTTLIVAAAILVAGCTTRFDIGGGAWAKPGAQIT